MTVKVMYRLLALIMTVFMFASMNTALAVDDAYPSTYKIGRASCRERVCQYV